jgi:hypothetical protein
VTSVTVFRATTAATVAFALGCSSSDGAQDWSYDAGDAESPPVTDSSSSWPEAAVPDSGLDAGAEAASKPDTGAIAEASTGGGCAPSWTTTPACGGGSNPPGPPPDFGPHVLIFDPSMSTSSIQSQLDSVNATMETDQFDNDGYAYLFKPGNYSLDVKVGFYTHVIGLGQSPDDVVITGAVRAKADWFGGNATQNFWRTAENLAVIPSQSIDNGVDVWAVSQGTSIRRAHVKGSIQLADGGGASGGFIADTTIDGKVTTGAQQQFLTRNDNLGTWQGAEWNMVFVGDQQAPPASWPKPPMTVVDATPVVREKPFLFIDGNGNYLVMAPDLKSASSGSSWASGMPPGAAVSIDRFYVVKPGITAATMNAALSQGKHLLLTPGDYSLDAPIQVTKPNTIVLGIGMPVLTPAGGNSLLTIADVDGVSIAGVLVEAGPMKATTLLEAGPAGSTADHSSNPTVLFDVHCRIGGNISGTASSCFTINSNDVIIDNSWLWRADHGGNNDPAAGSWNGDQSDTGIIVNGNDVTAYGLFVEHHQKYQTMWNGNGGSVYFYQSEMPYDPPSQSAWMSSPTENGYPSYKVADTVTSHQGLGIGVYSFFDNPVRADNAIETPTAPGIVMSHMMTFSHNADIANIINGTGGPATAYSSN